MESRKFFTWSLAISSLLASSAADAVKVQASPDFDMNVTVLLQARALEAWDTPAGGTIAGGAATGSPDGSPDTDFYLRRARLIASGTAYKKFTFYIMLDSPRFGIHGDYTTRALVQDAHVGYILAPDIEAEIGLLYMPLSHLAIISSSSTSSIEKGTEILFYNNQTGLRETGAHIRGLLFDKRVYFRGGIFEGLRGDASSANAITRTLNPKGRPLVAGMLRYNLLGYETGYSFPGIYLDGKSRVSVGVGGQYQWKGSNTPVSTISATGARSTNLTAVNDFVALAADIFADIALPGDTEFAINAEVYRFDSGAGSDRTGYGSTAEVGYRFGQIEPEVNFLWFNSESRQNNYLRIAGGFNYFLNRHQAKLSLEFWHSKTAAGKLDDATAAHLVVFQAQASF
jgi:hypothetical protein